MSCCSSALAWYAVFSCFLPSSELPLLQIWLGLGFWIGWTGSLLWFSGSCRHLDHQPVRVLSRRKVGAGATLRGLSSVGWSRNIGSLRNRGSLLQGKCCRLRIQQWVYLRNCEDDRRQWPSRRCPQQLLSRWARIPSWCRAQPALWTWPHISSNWQLNQKILTLVFLELVGLLVVVAHQPHVLAEHSIQRYRCKTAGKYQPIETNVNVSIIFAPLIALSRECLGFHFVLEAGSFAEEVGWFVLESPLADVSDFGEHFAPMLIV